MKMLLAILSCIILSGCSVVTNGSFIGIDQDTPEGVVNLVEKKFIGIPLLLGMEGSAVRLDSEWVLTAAHNNLLIKETLIKHPECDIALYRDVDESYGQTPAGKLFMHEEAFMIGYPPTPFPITSQKGQYIGEVKNLGWRGDCTYSAMTNTLISGLSGGGVFNTKGELVGVTHALMDGEVVWGDGTSHYRPSVFLSLLAVQEWLTEVTGNEYFK
jgi:hypothetical protein